jgi:hypothetical protein
MRHEEKRETPKQEASYHGEGFLRKALSHKKSMTKGKSLKSK